MKTKVNVILIVAALALYWVGVCNARAFYDPGTQRWLNRDPIGERGGINLFAAMRNDPVEHIDAVGFDTASAKKELADLGCCDCPAHAIENAEHQALQNIGDLVDWSTSGKRHSIKDYMNATTALSTAGKSGYRSAELEKMPACVRNAFEYVENNNILTVATDINTFNLALNPVSETPWFSFGDALAADEANRQKWLYQRLNYVQNRCAELKRQLAPCPCPTK